MAEDPDIGLKNYHRFYFTSPHHQGNPPFGEFA
jgi:hypothetical protein